MGSASCVTARHGAPPDWVRERSFAEEALSPILIAVEREVVAIAGIGDPLRPDARGTVERLRALGWQLEIPRSTTSGPAELFDPIPEEPGRTRRLAADELSAGDLRPGWRGR